MLIEADAGLSSSACRLFDKGLRSARGFAESLYTGLSRSRETGLGLEYVDFRDYVYGDDIRYVDWRLSARRVDPSGEHRLVVKVFQAERMINTVFVIDLTASMGFGEKLWMLGYVSMVVGSLAASLEDHATVLAVRDNIRVYAPRSPRELPLLLEGIVCRGEAPRGDLGLEEVAKRLRRARHRPVVLVTDYAHNTAEFYEFLRAMRAQRNHVYSVLLLDRYEVEEPIEDAVVALVDPETRAIARGRLRALYDAVRRHVAGVRAVAKLYSVSFLELLGKTGTIAMRHRLVNGYLRARSGLRAA